MSLKKKNGNVFFFHCVTSLFIHSYMAWPVETLMLTLELHLVVKCGVRMFFFSQIRVAV